MNIYGYTLPQVPERRGWIKIGQSEKDVERRIKEQLSQAHLQYEIVFNVSALAGKRNVTDKDIHRYLEGQNFLRDGHSEWFKCSPEDVQVALDFLKKNTSTKTSDKNFLTSFTKNFETGTTGQPKKSIKD